MTDVLKRSSQRLSHPLSGHRCFAHSLRSLCARCIALDLNKVMGEIMTAVAHERPAPSQIGAMKIAVHREFLLP